MQKTNAMRQLEAAGIEFETAEYSWDESDLSGQHIVSELGVDADCVFKTLVAKGDKNGYLVFCIPVSCELDLKKCAVAAKDKRVEMIHLKELLPLTGYLRGGCSPVGMKKKFPTYFDASAEALCELTVSSGTKGIQLLVSREDIVSFTGAVLADVTA